MMHGFGFPFFMGGPVFWLILLAAGFFLVRGLKKSRSKKRPPEDSLPDSRETDIYRLAAGKSGKITVSDVVTELGIEPKKAEEILDSMTDGIRVQMEVEDNGMLVYIFPEMKK
jgi:hypothetical protein